MLEPPSRDLLFASWARGFRLLRGERLGGVPPVPNSLTGEDESRLLEIASTYEGLAQSVKYQERFIFSGLSPWSRLDHVMRDSFIQSLTQIARWVAFLDHFMDSQAMDAVLVPIDCMPRQAAVVEVAKKKKLPNIVLLHGLPGHHSGNYFMNADTLALGGEIKNQFVAQGRDPGSIVTNCVCYLDPSVRSSGLPPPPKDGRNRVLLLTSTLFFQSCLSSPEDPEVYLNTVLDVLAGFPGLSITVRPHPSESPAYYRSLLAGRSGVRLEAQQDIEPLLDEHDIVIGPATTVLAEAAVLGKAVLCVNFTRCEYPPPLAPMGIPFRVQRCGTAKVSSGSGGAPPRRWGGLFGGFDPICWNIGWAELRSSFIFRE
ncbi:MAG: hypothetical protein IPP35_12235 [Elusimicrobia bacterium]|nr:hypothetical protein [Elusimicrobiota bacterium]